MNLEFSLRSKKKKKRKVNELRPVRATFLVELFTAVGAFRDNDEVKRIMGPNVAKAATLLLKLGEHTWGLSALYNASANWTNAELVNLENELGCAVMHDPMVEHDGEVGGIVAATWDSSWSAPPLPLNCRQ